MFRIEADHLAALRWPNLSAGLAEHLANQGYRTARDTDGTVLASDQLGHTTRYAPDAHGYIGRIDSPCGRRWTLDNDPSGRLRGLTDPAGTTLAVDYDAGGRPTHLGRTGGPGFALAFDGADNLTAARWPDGTTETFAYHDHRLLTAASDRAGATTRYDYDAAARLTAITDANGAVTRFDYGPWARPSAATFADGRRETYTWTADAADPTQAQLAAIGDADGVLARLAYTDGHLSRIAWRDGEIVSFRHDDAGRVVEARVGEQSVRFTYDAAGRVLREQSLGACIDYRYDAAGNLLGIDAPTGRIGYAWDPDLELAAITAWDGSRSEFATSADGLTQETQLSPRLHRRTRRTAAGHLAELALSAAGGPVYAARYGFDGEDRLTRLAMADGPTAGFTYDAAGRLTEFAWAEDRAAFAYDAAGHRCRAGAVTAHFDAAGKCLAQGHEHLRYDTRGRLIARRAAGVDWQYQWSERGLLTDASASTGVIVRFGYDAFARRTSKHVTDPQGQVTETWFLWAGEQLLAELRRGPHGTSRRDFLWYPGGATPFALRIDGAIYYCHHDHLGAVQRVTDAAGGQVWASGNQGPHAPWGGSTPSLAVIEQPWRLPGQYFDPETGLCYNRYRYFDPHLGRYLSPDPLGVLGGLDLYAYAENDPVNGADPLGLWTWSGALESVAVAVAAVAVGVAVIALAPIAAPLAIIAAGVAAGVVGGGLNAALNQESFCLSCILNAALAKATTGINRILTAAQSALTAVTDRARAVLCATAQAITRLAKEAMRTTLAVSRQIASLAAAASSAVTAFVKKGWDNAREQDQRRKNQWEIKGEGKGDYEGRFDPGENGSRFSTEASITVKKTLFDQELLMFGDQDGNNILIGRAQGELSTGYGKDLESGGKKFDIFNIGGSLTAIEGTARGTAVNNLLEGEVGFVAGSAKADAGVGATWGGKDGPAVKAGAGAEVIAVQGSAKGQVNITPKTIYDNTAGAVVYYFNPNSDYAALPSSWDHGVVVGAQGEAGIGAAAKAEGAIGMNNETGAFGVSGEAKVGAGPMAGVKLFLGIK